MKFIAFNATDGMFHYHKAGCRDLESRRARSFYVNGSWPVEGANIDEAVAADLANINAANLENGADGEAGWGLESVKIYPCCRH